MGQPHRPIYLYNFPCGAKVGHPLALVDFPCGAKVGHPLALVDFPCGAKVGHPLAGRFLLWRKSGTPLGPNYINIPEQLVEKWDSPRPHESPEYIYFPGGWWKSGTALLGPMGPMNIFIFRGLVEKWDIPPRPDGPIINIFIFLGVGGKVGQPSR